MATKPMQFNPGTPEYRQLLGASKELSLPSSLDTRISALIQNPGAISVSQDGVISWIQAGSTKGITSTKILAQPGVDESCFNTISALGIRLISGGAKELMRAPFATTSRTELAKDKALSGQLAVAEAKVKELEAHIETMATELESKLATSLADHEAKFEREIVSEKERIVAENSEHIATLEQQIHDLKSTIAKMASSEQTNLEDSKKTQRSLVDAERSAAKFAGELSALKPRLSEAEAKIRELQTQEETLNQRIEELLSEIEQKQRDLESLSSEHTTTKQSLEEAVAGRTAAENRLKDLEPKLKEHEDLETQLAEAMSRAEKAEKELAALAGSRRFAVADYAASWAHTLLPTKLVGDTFASIDPSERAQAMLEKMAALEKENGQLKEQLAAATAATAAKKEGGASS